MSSVLPAHRFPVRCATWRDHLPRRLAPESCGEDLTLSDSACMSRRSYSPRPWPCQGVRNRKRIPATHEMLNAALWRQSSAEYPAIARQTYRLAQLNLDQALADPQWTAALEQTGDTTGLPPAIIADLDETILDDTSYEVRIIRWLGSYYTREFCRLVPGRERPRHPGGP